MNEFFDRCVKILKKEEKELEYLILNFLHSERNSLESAFNLNAKLRVCATDEELRILIKNAVNIVFREGKTYEMLTENPDRLQKTIGIFRITLTYNIQNMSSYICIDTMSGKQ